MPHPHSLFLLADHHHHHDGTIEDEHEHEHAHEHEHEHEDSVAGPDAFATRGLVVQAATPEGVAGEQISLALEAFGGVAWSGASERLAWPRHEAVTSIDDAPDPPPPRSSAVIG